MRLAVRLFAGFILVLAEISAAAAEKRVALVIGNSSYEHVPQLANPSNDAAASGHKTAHQSQAKKLHADTSPRTCNPR